MATELLGDKVKHVVYLYRQGVINYDECREKLQPIVDEMNAIGREIAKKHGVKHRNIGIAGLMR